ncbi:sensor histidine kinase [Okibacterium fritillariae]|uniref:histidine kinase n=1 Tax=Okibacterium fritillariae TaxID=123320 RepID=A0A1T5IW08_9MICO|nr:HAMP domain-containing sensor histidine kinase [Okibacterium fritillariae]SKC43301.1 two-component system, OmpR family, sensor kinase [Okibacterium fritillariae]
MNDSLSEWWNSISLRTKITGVTVIVLAMGLLLAGVGTVAILKPALTNQVNAKLQAQAQNEYIAGLVDNDVVLDGSNSDFYVAFYNPTGEYVGNTWRSKPSSTLPVPPAIFTLEQAAGRDLVPFELHNANGAITYSAVAAPIRWDDGRSTGVAVVAMSMRETDNVVATYLTIFFGLGLGVIILGAVLTRLLVTSTFQPLRDVESTAAAIAKGDFSQRLSVSTPNTEVGRLNRSLNTMLNRIDQAFSDRSKTISQMRRFVGDASHELRTPLVTVRGYAELYRMGALQTPDDVAQAMERIEKEAIRMGGLVEDLLELARLDETKPLVRTVVDLTPIARDAAMDASAASQDRTVTVVADNPPQTALRATPATSSGPALGAAAGALASAGASAGAGTDPQAAAAAAARTGDTAPDASGAPTSASTDGQPSPLVRRSRADGTGPAAATGPIAYAGATLARLRSRRPRSGAPGVGRDTDEHDIIDLAASEGLDGVRPETPALVYAEENKIRQVVTNLIGNALRFTPPGSPIEIGVSANPATGTATIAVIDHGEGVPPQIREKIFERFWRADSSRTRETGGSGLGLAIVSSIIRAHEGTVTVDETPGGGATFRVTLPLLDAQRAAELAPRGGDASPATR